MRAGFVDQIIEVDVECLIRQNLFDDNDFITRSDKEA